MCAFERLETFARRSRKFHAHLHSAQEGCNAYHSDDDNGVENLFRVRRGN